MAVTTQVRLLVWSFLTIVHVLRGFQALRLAGAGQTACSSHLMRIFTDRVSLAPRPRRPSCLRSSATAPACFFAGKVWDLACMHGPHRRVVRTLRCGRDNPGSTPGVVMSCTARAPRSPAKTLAVPFPSARPRLPAAKAPHGQSCFRLPLANGQGRCHGNPCMAWPPLGAPSRKPVLLR